jgi:hypothetical protein
MSHEFEESPSPNESCRVREEFQHVSVEVLNPVLLLLYLAEIAVRWEDCLVPEALKSTLNSLSYRRRRKKLPTSRSSSSGPANGRRMYCRASTPGALCPACFTPIRSASELKIALWYWTSKAQFLLSFSKEWQSSARKISLDSGCYTSSPNGVLMLREASDFR